MDSPYLGMVQYFAFNFAPKGYLQCAGQLLNISQNAALFSLLGVTYGGDGRTTFALPDTRGRSIIGQGQNYTMGEKLGVEGVTLLTTNMPPHTHTASATIAAFTSTRAAATSNDPTAHYPSMPAPINTANTMYAATPDGTNNLGGLQVTVGVAGQSVPFNTMNPYLALMCTICNQGLFPSRN